MKTCLGRRCIPAAVTNSVKSAAVCEARSSVTAAEGEAELNAFEKQELEPFIKPICHIFIDIFEPGQGNNWLSCRAAVVVLHQLLGGTTERKVRDNVKALVQEDTIMKHIGLLKDNMWPGGQHKRHRVPSTAFEKATTRRDAGHLCSLRSCPTLLVA